MEGMQEFRFGNWEYWMSVVTIQEKSVTSSAVNQSDTASTTMWMSTCPLPINSPLFRLPSPIPFRATCLTIRFRRRPCLVSLK